jgi:hypothetical protein
MYVVTAGKLTIEETDLNNIGVIVTGVLTSIASSVDALLRLQENESEIIAVAKQKKKRVLILMNIDLTFIIESEGNLFHLLPEASAYSPG